MSTVTPRDITFGVPHSTRLTLVTIGVEGYCRRRACPFNRMSVRISPKGVVPLWLLKDLTSPPDIWWGGAADRYLTHWDLDKIAQILQPTFWRKSFERKFRNSIRIPLKWLWIYAFNISLGWYLTPLILSVWFDISHTLCLLSGEVHLDNTKINDEKTATCLGTWVCGVAFCSGYFYWFSRWFLLTHWGLITHICVTEFGRHWFKL